MVCRKKWYMSILLRQFTAGVPPASGPWCINLGGWRLLSLQRTYPCIVITPHLVFCSKQHQVPWLVNNAASFLIPPYDPDEFLDVLLCDYSPLFFSNSLFFILVSPQSSVLNPHHIQINSWVQVSLAWGTDGLKSYSKYVSANVCMCVCMHTCTPGVLWRICG